MDFSQPGVCQEKSCYKKSLELSEDHKNKDYPTSHCISKSLLQ